MKRFILWLLCATVTILLRLRYRIKVRGLHKIEALRRNQQRGTLFLPNHPASIDPVIISVLLRKFQARPMVVEYIYQLPGVRYLLQFIDALPVPNFETGNNSFKHRRGQRAFETMITHLRQGQAFLFYPAGRIKRTAPELLGGASGLHNILQQVPDLNIVLIRTTGLWGSSFSRALTGQVPEFGAVLQKSFKFLLGNLIVFTPRRRVLVEIEPVPSDFPYQGTRQEINRYLEEWYNRPFADQPTKGEPLVLVSYSIWSRCLPTLNRERLEQHYGPENVPPKVRKQIIAEIARLSQHAPEQIQPQMDLSADLGMDSLDIATLITFLQDRYDVEGVSPEEITTVESALIATLLNPQKEHDFSSTPPAGIKRWLQRQARPFLPHGATIPAAFLHACRIMGKAPACADEQSGILSYKALKLRVLVLAEYIRPLPGERIGILLPASVGAYAVILGTMLAGKVPVMVNWTTGPRHLRAVVQSAGLEVILSSWKFLDVLSNVDFGGMEDRILLLEELLADLSLRRKLSLLLRCQRSDRHLLQRYIPKADPHCVALLLFTSGTEGVPKGVPLTHHNILSNQIASSKAANLVEHNDIICGILPPFHAFGINTTGLLPLLSGLRVAFYPDPTDSKALAHYIARWGITLICGTPSFIKAILHVAQTEQLRTMRLFVVGAEKAPRDLFTQVQQLGIGAEIIEGYGVTEAAPVLTINRPGRPCIGVGQPLENVRIQIIHPQTHQPLPAGQRGHIIARGPNIFKGYLEKNSPVPFITINGEQWYLTGDLGILDEQNHLTISGRIKRFVKIGGEMISLPALEETLTQVVLAAQQAPESQEDASEQQGPPLAIVAHEQAGEKPQIILFSTLPLERNRVNTILKEHGFSNLSKITAVHQLPQIPLTGTGKVDYRALANIIPNTPQS